MRRVGAALRTDLGRRLQRVLSAQLYNQITTILVQLGLVPVLLYAWGTNTYGSWILLSAIPTYLTFSDFGFTLIAKNEMLMHVAGGRRDEALCTFQSVFALLNVIVPTVIGVSFILLFGFDFSKVFNLGGVPIGEARLILALLLVNVMTYQYFLLICGGVRCENRLATEASWGATARLGEGMAVGLTALCGGGLLVAAIMTLATRMTFTLVLYFWLRRASPWLNLGHRLADRREVRRLLKPALAFMLLPISQALLIQAPIMIVGALMSPVAVVTFATTRTLTRVGTAATNMLNGTLQGEYSAAFGRRDATMLHRVTRYHRLLSLAMVAVYGVILHLLQRPLMTSYTHGKVHAVEPFFSLMILTIAAEMMWSSIATPLESINRHVTFANILMAICVAGVGLCYVMTASFALNGAAGAMLIVHASVILLCLALSRSVTVPALALANV